MTAKPKTATPAKTAKTTEVSEELVSAYLALATGRNSSTWEFFAEALKYSVRVRKDSIAKAQKDTGFSLSDVTPTKSQYFETLARMEKKFHLSQSMPFAKAISLAGKADVTLKAEGARALVTKSKTVEAFAEALPKTTRKARPASEKSEGEFSGEVSDILALSIEEILESVVDLAQRETSEEREEIAKRLTAVAKLVRAMNTVSA